MFKEFRLNRFSFTKIAGTTILLAAVLFFSAPRENFTYEETPVALEYLEHDSALQTQADNLLSFFDHMPSVPVYLKDEPIVKTGSNVERGVAYTHCLEGGQPQITIKKTFYERTNPRQLENILKHELTHAWLCRNGQMSGHDAVFRRKFKEIGGFGN